VIVNKQNKEGQGDEAADDRINELSGKAPAAMEIRLVQRDQEDESGEILDVCSANKSSEEKDRPPNGFDLFQKTNRNKSTSPIFLTTTATSLIKMKRIRNESVIFLEIRLEIMFYRLIIQPMSSSKRGRTHH
jgi:hypothetical protein